MNSRPTRTQVKPINTRPSKTEQFLSDDERQEFRGYDLDVENLALEGGGSVGIAHIGAIKVLEELGYLKKIKRFAGTSAGALVATMLALGHNCCQIEKVIQRDFKPIIKDGGCWVLCNLIGRFGAYPGRKLEELIANTIKDKNYTFKQLYDDKKGVELCILATDVTKMDTVYFHVKTTPDMPIYLAARASASLPVLLEPVKWKQGLFVDGGVICNYPVHAYDGWYLSMEEGDHFLTRFSKLAKNMGERLLPAEWFDTVNKKTLGVMLYSDSDKVLMKEHMEKRTSRYPQEEGIRPDTKLSRRRPEQQVGNRTTEIEKMTSALGRLLTVLDSADLDRNGTVSKQEFRDFCKRKTENGLTKEDIELLFGTVRSKNIADEIFATIDTGKNEKIEYNEIGDIKKQQEEDLSQTRQNISSVKKFVTALFQTVMLHAQRVNAKSYDCSRTIGINTGYLETFDWSMEPDDKDFLIKCGKRATLCFLRERRRTPNAAVDNREEGAAHHDTDPPTTSPPGCILPNHTSTN